MTLGRLPAANCYCTQQRLFMLPGERHAFHLPIKIFGWHHHYQGQALRGVLKPLWLPAPLKQQWRKNAKVHRALCKPPWLLTSHRVTTEWCSNVPNQKPPWLLTMKTFKSHHGFSYCKCIEEAIVTKTVVGFCIGKNKNMLVSCMSCIQCMCLFFLPGRPTIEVLT